MTVESVTLVVDCAAHFEADVLTNTEIGIAMLKLVADSIERETEAPRVAPFSLVPFKDRIALLHVAHSISLMISTDDANMSSSREGFFLGLWWLVAHQLADSAQSPQVVTIADCAFALGVLTKVAASHGKNLIEFREKHCSAAASDLEGTFENIFIREQSASSSLRSQFGDVILRALTAVPSDGSRHGEPESSSSTRQGGSDEVEEPGGDDMSAYKSGNVVSLLSTFAFLTSPYVDLALGSEMPKEIATAPLLLPPPEFVAAAKIFEKVIGASRMLRTSQLSHLFSSLARLADMGASKHHQSMFRYMTEEAAVVTPRTISLLVDRMQQVSRYLVKLDVLTFLPAFATLLVNLVNKMDFRMQGQQLLSKKEEASKNANTSSLAASSAPAASRFTKRRDSITPPQSQADTQRLIVDQQKEVGKASGVHPVSENDIADLEEESDLLLHQVSNYCIGRIQPINVELDHRRYDVQASVRDSLRSKQLLLPSEIARCAQALETLGFIRFDFTSRLAAVLERHLHLFENNAALIHAMSVASRSPFSDDCALGRRLFSAEADGAIRDWFAVRVFRSSRTYECNQRKLIITEIAASPVELFSVEQTAEFLLSYARTMPWKDSDRGSYSLRRHELLLRCTTAIDEFLTGPMAMPPCAEIGVSPDMSSSRKRVRFALISIAALSTYLSRIGLVARCTGPFPSFEIVIPLATLNRALTLLEESLAHDPVSSASSIVPASSLKRFHRVVAPHIILEALVNLADLAEQLRTENVPLRCSATREIKEKLERPMGAVLELIQASFVEACSTRDELFLRRMFGSIYSDEFLAKALRLVPPLVGQTLFQRLARSNRFLSASLIPFAKDASSPARLVDHFMGLVDRQCRNISSMVQLLRSWHTSDRVLSSSGMSLKIRCSPSVRSVVLKKIRLYMRPGQSLSPSDVVELVEMFGHDEEIVAEVASRYAIGQEGHWEYMHEVSMPQIERMLKSLCVSREAVVAVMTALLPDIRRACEREWSSVACAVTVLEFFSKYLPREARTIPLTRAGSLQRGAIGSLSLSEYCRVFNFFHESQQPGYMEEWRRAFVSEMRNQRSALWFPPKQVLQMIDAPLTSSTSNFRRALRHTLRIKLLLVFRPQVDPDADPAEVDPISLLSMLELHHWKYVLEAEVPLLFRRTGYDLERRTGSADRQESPNSRRAAAALSAIGKAGPHELPTLVHRLMFMMSAEHLRVVAGHLGDCSFLDLCQHILADFPELDEKGQLVHWRKVAAEIGLKSLTHLESCLCLKDSANVSSIYSLDLRHWLPTHSASNWQATGVVLHCAPDEASREQLLRDLQHAICAMSRKTSMITTCKAPNKATADDAVLHIAGIGAAALWAREALFSSLLDESSNAHHLVSSIDVLQRFFGSEECWCVWSNTAKSCARDEVELAHAVTLLVAAMLSSSPSSCDEGSSSGDESRIAQQIGQFSLSDTCALFSLMDACVVASSSFVDMAACEEARAGLLLRLEELMAGAESGDVFEVVRSVLASVGSETSASSKRRADRDLRRLLGKVAWVVTNDLDRFVADCGAARVRELAELLSRGESLSEAQEAIFVKSTSVRLTPRRVALAH